MSLVKLYLIGLSLMEVSLVRVPIAYRIPVFFTLVRMSLMKISLISCNSQFVGCQSVGFLQVLCSVPKTIYRNDKLSQKHCTSQIYFSETIR